MPLDVSKAPAAASPLWIIALFIALSEATAGIAAITTNGATRLIFAYFAVGFPAVVFGVFVWLLVKYAPNLYSPGQYSRDITPEIYRFGIGISRTESLILGRAVAETVAPLLRGGNDDEEACIATAEQIARRIETAVIDSSVAVSLSDLKPGERDLRIPVTEETSVTQLLDGIYFALIPAIAPDSYQETWTLLDESGRELSWIGKSWARDRGMLRDERHIADAGIFPGSTLTAVAKRN